jgi:hypothetical protein
MTKLINRLTVAGFNGNCFDCLNAHNGMRFTTFDYDNDMRGGDNCDVMFRYKHSNAEIILMSYVVWYYIVDRKSKPLSSYVHICNNLCLFVDNIM